MSSSFPDVNSARKELFTKKNTQFDHLPPTSASLYQHILRAFYQACFVWGEALIKNPNLPSPEQWGWQRCGQKLTVKWTTLDSVSEMCKELCKCSC